MILFRNSNSEIPFMTSVEADKMINEKEMNVLLLFLYLFYSMENLQNNLI